MHIKKRKSIVEEAASISEIKVEPGIHLDIREKISTIRSQYLELRETPIIMASITFSNEQFKKIVELVYLGNWMKNSFHVPEEAEYDTPADDILDYLAMFAKEHGMKEFLTSSDKPTRSAKIDDMTSAAIDSYNADNMFEELIEQLTYRAFDEKHGRLPAFKGEHTSHEEQEEFNRIRAEFEMEFEQNGLRRVVVNRKMK